MLLISELPFIRTSQWVSTDEHAKAIVKPPFDIVPYLADTLEPDLEINTKHGVIGLIKHLAQSKENRAILGQAGVLHKIAASGVWRDVLDVYELPQLSAIGAAKHLCNGNGMLETIVLRVRILTERRSQKFCCLCSPAFLTARTTHSSSTNSRSRAALRQGRRQKRRYTRFR